MILSSNCKRRERAGCTVACTDGSKDVYDGCIMAAHAPDTLRMLGKEATFDETRILGAFQYVYRYFTPIMNLIFSFYFVLFLEKFII